MMRAPIPTLVVSTAVLSTLLGCAPLFTASDKNWQDGWRDGEVVALSEVAATGFGKPLHCGVPPRYAESTVRIVSIEYKRLGRQAWWTAAVPAGFPLQVRDLVSFNVRDCTAPIRIRKSS